MLLSCRWSVFSYYLQLKFLRLSLPLLISTISNFSNFLRFLWLKLLFFYVQIISFPLHEFELLESKAVTGVKKLKRKKKESYWVLVDLHMISYYMMCCYEINIFIPSLSLSLTFLSSCCLSPYLLPLSLIIIIIISVLSTITTLQSLLLEAPSIFFT